MPLNRSLSLHQVRADWLRVQGEVAWVRMLLAGQQYFDALQREQRFNPNHDDRGRFTFGDGASTSASQESGTVLNREGRERVAQAGPARPASRGPILARFPGASPAQEVRWAISDISARQEIAQTETVIPGYRPRASLTSTIEGEILRNEADARDAREARARVESGSLTGAAGPMPGATPRSLADICLPNGQLIGQQTKRAGSDVRTLSPHEFDQLLRDMTFGAQEAKTPTVYEGIWYRRASGETIGVRRSEDYGLTIDIVDGLGHPVLSNIRRIHEK